MSKITNSYNRNELKSSDFMCIICVTENIASDNCNIVKHMRDRNIRDLSHYGATRNTTCIGHNLFFFLYYSIIVLHVCCATSYGEIKVFKSLFFNFRVDDCDSCKCP